MTDRLAFTDFRRDLAEMLDRVEHQGHRLLVERHGRTAAAVVPARDLELMDAIQEHLEEERAREAVGKALTEGGKAIPYDALRRELELD